MKDRDKKANKAKVKVKTTPSKKDIFLAEHT